MAMPTFRFSPRTTAIANQYFPVILDPLDPAIGNISCKALNNAAIVAGQSNTANALSTACRWLAGSPFDLNGLCEEESSAQAIDDNNVICGYATLRSGIQQAALWQDGKIRNLGSLNGLGANSNAFAISSSGPTTVYGESELLGNRSRAVYWRDLEITALEHNQDWLESSATAVAFGNIPAGYALSQSQTRRLTILWNSGPVELPGLTAASSSEPTAGSLSGYLVGWSDRGPGTRREAVLFQTSGPSSPAVSLQTLQQAITSEAYGVNIHGVAVGRFDDASNQATAFIYAAQGSATMIDLNTLLAPGSGIARVYAAMAINDYGVILAECDFGGSSGSVLLWPI